MENNHLEFFRQINDYFDKVYVVTIPRLKERQVHTSRLLEGLEFEFVNGTDKEKLSDQDIEEVYDTFGHLKLSRFNKALRRGEVACAMSHLEVYRLIVENSYERVLVLEDDIDLVEEHLGLIADFFRHLPENWEMAYLGYWKNEKQPKLGWIKQGFYVLLSMLGLHKWSYKRHLNTYPKVVNDYVWSAGNHEGAYAYALTSNGSKKLLEFNQPIVLNADHLFSHLITNEELLGYLAVHKFFKPMAKDGKKFFGSETDEQSG